jgi:hypothetical protein
MINHSPRISTDGLVFYYDMGNLNKSWSGLPTTNLVGDGMSIYNNVPSDVSISLTATSEKYKGATVYKQVITPITATGVSYLTGGGNPGIGVVSGGGGGEASRYTGHAIFYKPTTAMHGTPLFTNYSNIAGWGAGPLGSNRSISMGDGWFRGEVIWFDTVTRSDGKYWAINPANASLNIPITIYWAAPFKEDRNDSTFVSPYTTGTRLANNNLESTPSFPSWNTLSGSSASGGTLTFASGSYNNKSGWDLYKTYSGLTAGVNYTWSALVKSGTASNLIVTMNNTSAWNTGPGEVFAGFSSTEWRRIYITGTTSSGSFNLHLGASFNNELQNTVQTGGTIFIQDVRLQLTASQTAISDLTDQNTINASSLTYASDGTFSFNGSSNWIESPTSPVFDSQSITMESWNKPTTTSQSGFLFEKGQVNTQYSNFYNGDGTFYFRTIGLSPQDLTFTASTHITAGQWNHVVCTVGGGTKTVYINGIQRYQQAGVTGTMPTGQTNQYVGKYGSGGIEYPFNGSIAVSRVYNRSLTASEVLQNFNALRGRYGV